MPLPRLALGRHTLQIAVEIPQRVESEAVTVTLVLDHAVRFRLLAPADGAVLPHAATPLRWTAVPGSAGYEIEIYRPSGGAAGLRKKVGLPFFSLAGGDREALAPGLWLWQVRPLFPGGVAGVPSAPRRLALLPPALELSLLAAAPAAGSDRLRLSWHGGAPGVLYRVDVLPAGKAASGFSALTAGDGYLLPAHAARAAPGRRIRLTAWGPGGIRLGEAWGAPPAAWPASSVRQGTAADREPPVLGERSPEPGSRVTTSWPLVEASWEPGLAEAEVSLALDGTDVTTLASLGSNSLSYVPPEPLARGEHTAILTLAGTAFRWSFTVEPGAEEESSAAAVQRFWTLSADGLLSFSAGDDYTGDQVDGSLALAGQIDRSRPGGNLGGTATVAFSRSFSHGGGEDENHNWLFYGGRDSSSVARHAAGQIGYVSPSFLVSSELAMVGLADGGAEAGVTLPGGLALSYYGTLDLDPASQGGGYGGRQTVRASSLALPGASGRLELRAVAVEVEEEGGDFSFGGRGSLGGLLASYTSGTALQVVFEGMRGAFTPAAGSFEPEQRGDAYSLRLLGAGATWTGSAALRHSEAGFVNPANRGYTAGGLADRSSADLAFGKRFGPSSLNLAYRHIEGGETGTRLDAGELSFSAPLGRAVTFSLSGNASTTRSAGDEELFFPALDLASRGASLLLSESLGSLTLTQTVLYQESDDREDPHRFVAVTDAGLSAILTPIPNLTLFTLVQGTRTRMAAAFGTAENFLATLEPAWSLPDRGWSLRSSASLTRSRSDLEPGTTKSEAYRLALSWNPDWQRSLCALEVGADWYRLRFPGSAQEGFVRSYTASLALRWGSP